MKNKEIKQNVDNLFNIIKEANQKLKNIRQQCLHKDTHMGNYSWRIGVINQVEMCDYCDEVIKYPDHFAGNQVTTDSSNNNPSFF